MICVRAPRWNERLLWQEGAGGPRTTAAALRLRRAAATPDRSSRRRRAPSAQLPPPPARASSGPLAAARGEQLGPLGGVPDGSCGGGGACWICCMEVGAPGCTHTNQATYRREAPGPAAPPQGTADLHGDAVAAIARAA